MKFFILFALYFLGKFAVAGGVAVGNGGMVARCGMNDHFVSLDYLLTYDFFGKNVRPLVFNSNTDALLRISALITKKMPKVSSSFEEFVAYLNNESDFSKPYVWVRVYRDDSMYLTDGQNIDHIPTKCRMNSVPQIQFYQAVIRTKRDSSPNANQQIIFYYSHSVFSDISALQLSFLQVHEWLWNFTNDVQLIRKLNYFIHSNLFDEYSKVQTQELLTQWGLGEML